MLWIKIPAFICLSWCRHNKLKHWMVCDAGGAVGRCSCVAVPPCLPGFIIKLHVFPVLLILFGGIYGCKINEHEHHINWTDTWWVGRCFMLVQHDSRFSTHLMLQLNSALKYCSGNSWGEKCTKNFQLYLTLPELNFVIRTHCAVGLVFKFTHSGRSVNLAVPYPWCTAWPGLLLSKAVARFGLSAP